MKDQITYLPDNADRSVAKQKFKITNWPTYNKALINRGSITFWLDDEAIQAWYESATPSSRGRPQRYSDLAITTVLVIKRVFRLTLRAAQGFIDSIFSLMNVPLRCPDYSCVSRRAKSVNISFKTPTRGEIAHLVIDSTGLKVFGEGEWKVKKHGQERRRIWRKLHLAVDSKTHEIICADLSLNNVTDSEAFPGLIRQTHRKIRSAAADGAYDTRLCHDELRRKKISALIPPRKGAGYWPGEYADRNRAVANQRMTGSNARWKWTTDYNRRSIAETAMYRVKQLFGGSLTLRDYDGQVAEAMALVRALNKMTKAGFSYISKNWAGQPLVDIETVVNLISNTTTRTGLKVRCDIDNNVYLKGTKITDEEFDQIALDPIPEFGTWNYIIRGFKHDED